MKSQITDIDSGSFRKISYYLTSSDSNYICLNIKNKRIFLEFLENTYKFFPFISLPNFPVNNFDVHKRMVYQIAHLKYYPFNSYIYASCADEKDIILWDILSNTVIQRLIGHNKSVNCILYLENDEVEGKKDLLLSGSDDFNIKLWQSSKGECLITLSGHDNGVNNLFFLDNYIFENEELCNVYASVSISMDETTIKLWNILKYNDIIKPFRTEVLKKRVRVIYFYFDDSEQNYYMIFSSNSETIFLTDLLNSTQYLYQGHQNLVCSLIGLKSFKDNSYIVSGDEQGVLIIWKADSRETYFRIKQHSGWITTISFFLDVNNCLYIVTGSRDEYLKILDLERKASVSINNMNLWEISHVLIGEVCNKYYLFILNYSSNIYLYQI